MIRVSIIVIVLLIVSIDAKPLNKLSDEHMKEMVVSTDDNGKLFWGVMVEPPEDLDRIQFEVDPSMKIWNSMKNSGQDKQYLKPEEDLDEIYHPSTSELRAQMRKFGYQAKEKDEDQYLPARIEHSSEREVRIHLQPEEDIDDLYHKQPLISVLQQEVAEAPADLPSQRKYAKPEEDLDDIYHKKLLLPVLQQEVAEAPADIPSQRKYANPEEDLDGLYHK
ncbi:hypothetical protein CRENBAI_014185 [Crenichthys baileyi]|uniref:Uncharacterized protein n=1 Tax=Crenichthys baileyi TaxID=28760 RepID=A0AAV9R029_9TELE